ncbi:hypothetical protein GCM10010430_76910 [Kitasatospora cystarginea]|uniref:Tyr recombinase domain-containing protein n=1 Tax=Kitasatospora cystarginea TaxID=58350 RepID=A0ABN3EZY2_9ACTN
MAYQRAGVHALALGLRWTDVDLKGGILPVRKNRLRPKYKHGCAGGWCVSRSRSGTAGGPAAHLMPTLDPSAALAAACQSLRPNAPAGRYRDGSMPSRQAPLDDVKFRLFDRSARHPHSGKWGCSMAI